MGYPMTQNEEDLWRYIRKLESEIIDLRARIINLEEERKRRYESNAHC